MKKGSRGEVICRFVPLTGWHRRHGTKNRLNLASNHIKPRSTVFVGWLFFFSMNDRFGDGIRERESYGNGQGSFSGWMELNKACNLSYFTELKSFNYFCINIGNYVIMMLKCQDRDQFSSFSLFKKAANFHIHYSTRWIMECFSRWPRRKNGLLPWTKIVVAAKGWSLWKYQLFCCTCLDMHDKECTQAWRMLLWLLR